MATFQFFVKQDPFDQMRPNKPRPAMVQRVDHSPNFGVRHFDVAGPFPDGPAADAWVKDHSADWLKAWFAS